MQQWKGHMIFSIANHWIHKRKIHVMPNLHAFFSSVKHKRRDLEECWNQTVLTSKRKSYRFGTTWKWVTDSVDRNALQLTRITQSDYIFQATILQDDIRVTLSNKASFSHLLTELSCPGVGSKRRGVVCTASTCYCSSSLNVNIYLFQ